MARPTTRTPRAVPDADQEALAPAPDSGVPYTANAQSSQAQRSSKHQLGVRIPEELWQRLSAISESTGASVTHLVTRAIEEKVSAMETN